jgi:2-dehydro-3-deoxygluconokinase
MILDVRAGSDPELAKVLCDRFGLTTVILTSRVETGTRQHRIGSLMVHQGEVYEGGEYQIEVVDRLGGGDSFCAAVLAALIRDEPKTALNLAGAYSALQHTHPGDFNYNYPDEYQNQADEP